MNNCNTTSKVFNRVLLEQIMIRSNASKIPLGFLLIYHYFKYHVYVLLHNCEWIWETCIVHTSDFEYLNIYIKITVNGTQS